MNSNIDLIKENLELKKKIKLYEVSTKLDYQKILLLKEEINNLQSLILSHNN